MTIETYDDFKAKLNEISKHVCAARANGRNAKKDLIKRLSHEQQDSFINKAVTELDSDVIEAFKLSCPYRVNKALDTELVNKITQQNYKTFNTLAKYAFAGGNGRNARKKFNQEIIP